MKYRLKDIIHLLEEKHQLEIDYGRMVVWSKSEEIPATKEDGFWYVAEEDIPLVVKRIRALQNKKRKELRGGGINLTVTIHPVLYDRLQRVAKAQKCSGSTVMNEALRAYFKTKA